MTENKFPNTPAIAVTSAFAANGNIDAIITIPVITIPVAANETAQHTSNVGQARKYMSNANPNG